MFKSLDKNNDGFMSKEEVKGTPHDKDFSKLDKNNDGKLRGRSMPPRRSIRRRVRQLGCQSRSRSTSKPAESSSKPKY